MTRWYIHDQLKMYGPYTQQQIEQFINENKIIHIHQLSSDQKNWHTPQQFMQIVLEQTREQNYSKQNIDNTKRVGKYEIIRELGRGGMGVVYYAMDTSLKRECAIKVMLSSNNENSQKRFSAEAEAIAKLNHPNIIRIQERSSFTDQNGNSRWYFAMDHIKGRSLESVIKEDKVKLATKLEIFRQICAGIEYAHKNQVLHRDLKPVNIIVTDENIPIILDFGLAKKLDVSIDITKTGDIFGTPQYMAPENIKGEKISDVRSDIYSLGVILYKILTGRTPFQGNDAMEVFFQITTSPVIPPSSLNNQIKKNSYIEVVCMKCLEKDVNKRMPTAKFLHEEISNILNNEPIRTKPLSIWQKTLRVCKYNKTARYALVTGGFGLITIALVMIYFVNRAAIAEDRAEIAEDKAAIAEKDQLLEINHLFSALDQGLTIAEKNLEDVNFSEALAQLAVNSNNLNKGFDKLNPNIKEKGRFDLTENIDPYKIITKFKLQIKFSTLPSLPIVEKSYRIPLESLTSPKGNYIVYRNDSHLIIKNINENKEILLKEQINVIPLLFSPNERYIIFRKKNDELNVYEVKIYDISIKEFIFFENNGIQYSGKVQDISFSPNSKYVAYSKAQGFFIYDFERNKKILCFKQQAQNFAFSLDYLVFFVDENINNKNHFVHSLQSHRTTLVSKWESTMDSDIVCDPLQNRFYFMGITSFHSYSFSENDQEIKINKALHNHILTDDRITAGAAYDDLIALGIKKELMLMKKVREQYYPSPHQAIAEIRKIQFLSADILFCLTKSDSFQVFDSLNENFLFLQEGVEELNIIENKKFSILHKKGEADNFLSYEIMNWSPNLHQNLKPHKKFDDLFKKARDFFGRDVNSHPIQIKKIDSEYFIFSSLGAAISSWIDKKYSLSIKILYQIYDIAISFDNSSIAIVLNNKQHSPSQQSIILADLQNTEHLDNLLNIKPIVVDTKVGDTFIHLKNVEDGLKRQRETRAIAFSSDSNFLYIPYQNEIQRYSITEKVMSFFTSVKTKIRNIKVHPKHKLISVWQEEYITILSEENPEKIWHEQTFNLINSQSNYLNSISPIIWHPQKKMLASADIDGSLKIYYLPEEQKNFIWKVHQTINFHEEIYNLSFSPDGKYLAIFTFSDIYIYDMENQVKTKIYIGYYKGGSANFSDDWSYAVFPSTDGKVLIFDQKYFLDENEYLKKIKDKGYKKYFWKSESEDGIPGNYWPLKLQENFQKYFGKK